MSNSNLEDKIENLRKKLNFLLSEKKDLTSGEVVNISQELDIVLNQYNEDGD